MPDNHIDKDVQDKILYGVKDHNTQHGFPMLTTLYYQVCNQNADQFEKVTDIIEAYIQEAYTWGYNNGRNST